MVYVVIVVGVSAMSKPDVTYLSKEGIAQACDVSLPTVTKWLNDAKIKLAQDPDWTGCPVKIWGGNGKSFEIDLAKLNAWHQEIETAAREEEARQQEAIAQNQSSLDLEGGNVEGEAALPLKIRKQGAETVLAEHKAQTERGQLTRSDDAQAEFERVFKFVSTRLQGFPDWLQRTANLSVEAHALVQDQTDKWQEILARECMTKSDDRINATDDKQTGGDAARH